MVALVCVNYHMQAIVFTEAKKHFSSAIEPLEGIHHKIMQLAKKTASPEFEVVEALPTARVAEILRVVGQSEMKVVFFGRTSNGKSTVINALLKSKVLPSGPGSTTTTLCYLRGQSATTEGGFVKFKGSNESLPVEVCLQLLHTGLNWPCTYAFLLDYSFHQLCIHVCTVCGQWCDQFLPLYLFLLAVICSGTG